MIARSTVVMFVLAAGLATPARPDGVTRDAPLSDAAFLDWARVFGGRHDAVVVDAWTADLDGRPPADHVALLCSTRERDWSYGYYLIASANRRWSLWGEMRGTPAPGPRSMLQGFSASRISGCRRPKFIGATDVRHTDERALVFQGFASTEWEEIWIALRDDLPRIVRHKGGTVENRRYEYDDDWDRLTHAEAFSPSRRQPVVVSALMPIVDGAPLSQPTWNEHGRSTTHKAPPHLQVSGYHSGADDIILDVSIDGDIAPRDVLRIWACIGDERTCPYAVEAVRSKDGWTEAAGKRWTRGLPSMRTISERHFKLTLDSTWYDNATGFPKRIALTAVYDGVATSKFVERDAHSLGSMIRLAGGARYPSLDVATYARLTVEAVD